MTDIEYIQGLMENLITQKQAAKRIKVSFMSIQRWVKQGKVPYLRVKSKILIDPMDIPTYLRVKNTNQKKK